MDHTFRFILEEPNTGSAKGQNNRKRARLVTACDNCRIKKIKCNRIAPFDSESPCEACKVGSVDCSYTDRDRYQNERGLSFASTTNPTSPTSPTEATPTSRASEEPGRKRKASIVDSISEDNTTTSNSTSSGPADRRNSNAESLASQFTQKPYVEPNGFPKLESPTREQDPALKRITVPFFRYFGPTANTPGYRRVKVRTLTLNEVGSPLSSSSEGGNLPSTLDADTNPNYPYRQRVHPDAHPFFSNSTPNDGSVNATFQSNTTASGFFDQHRPRYPSSKFLPQLTALFFDHLACHFPFLDRQEVTEAAENETLPAVLANCIAALATRFSDHPELLKSGKRYSAGEAFSDMAKLLVVHMLSWPSLEIVQGLVLIAWAEFGSGRDSGLWMYSRMAVAMAMDLGLQFEATVQLAPTAMEKEKIRLTWWAVLLIDRINSWGTGRPIAIADDQFDTALPFTPVDPHEDISKAPPPSLVFGHLASLVMLRGKMGDVLNNPVKNNKDLTLEMELTQLQYEMTTWYQSLTPSLVFNIHNFRRFSQHKQSSIFLLLHCMFHSVISLLHRPSLLQRFTPEVALPLANSIDLSRSSARSLVDMVALADEMDSESLIANPFLDLPILTAARGFLAEREYFSKPQGDMPPMTILVMRQWCETSLDRCKDALRKMSKFWGGVGCVKRILDQQSTGDLDFDVGEGSSGDTHVAHLRDVELITQWATKAWRRHTAEGKPTYPKLEVLQLQQQPSLSKSALLGGAMSNKQQQLQQQAFPVSANNPNPPANSNSSNTNPLAYLDGSPAGATVGISGILDSAFNFGPATGPDSLRVSFNTAEADLSFPNSMSTELFTIPDGLEEFLGSTMDTTGIGGSTNGTGGLDLSGAANGFPGQLDHPMNIPAFSTLIGPWFPMGQFSRAPSPVPNGSK